MKCGHTLWMENIFKTTGYGADEKRQVGRFCISCAYFEPENGENFCGIDGDIPAIKTLYNRHTRKNTYYL